MVTDRKGQAFIELAAGMLILSLVLSALFAFAEYITRSLAVQRDLRKEAGKNALTSLGGFSQYSRASDTDTLELERYAARYIFGAETVEIKESVAIPNMK